MKRQKHLKTYSIGVFKYEILLLHYVMKSMKHLDGYVIYFKVIHCTEVAYLIRVRLSNIDFCLCETLTNNIRGMV